MKNVSRKSKINIYKAIIKPSVLYGSETWTVTKKDEQRINIWERKVLRRMFGPVNERGERRLKTNKEIYQFYNGLKLVTVIKAQRLK